MSPPSDLSPREVTYEWSRDLIRRGVWRFLSRYAGRSLVAALILVALGVIAALAGFPAWMPWLSIGVPIGIGLVWLRYYHYVTKLYDEMPDRRVTVRIEPESITFRTSEHVSTIKWSLIKSAWSFPDVLLVFIYGRTNYLALPDAPIAGELRQYVEDRIRAHGGKVS